MKTLIIYCSQYGTTESCVNYLVQQLPGSVEVQRLEKGVEKGFALETYDRVLLGGSLRGGRVQKSLQQFCRQNQEQLTAKELGLFICCGLPEQEGAVFADNFGPALAQQAVKGNFGGELNPEKMGFVAKQVVKLIRKAEPDRPLPTIDWPAVQQFAAAFPQ